MFKQEDIIINKKNPSYILKVINDNKDCIIVGSSNTDLIGRKTRYKEDKFYELETNPIKKIKLNGIALKYTNNRERERIKFKTYY